MAYWLARSTLDREVQVQVLAVVIVWFLGKTTGHRIKGHDLLTCLSHLLQCWSLTSSLTGRSVVLLLSYMELVT